MFYEPSTLASTTALLATSLREEYGIDPEPIFLQANVQMVSPESQPIGQDSQAMDSKQRGIRG